MQRYLKVPVIMWDGGEATPEKLHRFLAKFPPLYEWGVGDTEEEAFEDLKRKLGYEEASPICEEAMQITKYPDGKVMLYTTDGKSFVLHEDGSAVEEAKE